MILDQADSWEQYLPLTQRIDCLYADEYWLALSYICSPLQLHITTDKLKDSSAVIMRE